MDQFQIHINYSRETIFSIRWTGTLIPKYSEEYVFRVYSDGARITIDGKILVDTMSSKQQNPFWSKAGKLKLIAGKEYDIKVEYQHSLGLAALKLVWSSPSIPEETIDPLVDMGINVTDWTTCFTDIVKGARNNWEDAKMDKDGWPTNDGSYVFKNH